MAGSIAEGGMTFTWVHAGGRLHGTLTAPTRGWLAVGFNDARALEGTRFFIAVVAGAAPVAEVHVALVPEHPPIEALGGRSGLADVAGAFAGGVSRATFSLPEVGGAPYAADLRAGARTHLMLAWSHGPEFDHHSAWRGHFDMVL